MKTTPPENRTRVRHSFRRLREERGGRQARNPGLVSGAPADTHLGEPNGRYARYAGGDLMAERLVFISHAGEDTWIAQKIASDVSELGARSFLDRANVDIGAEFEDRIRDFLDRTHELLVLFTPWSLDRPYVWMEIGIAWGRKIPVVVVLLGITPDEFLSRPTTPVFLKKHIVIRLNDVQQYLVSYESAWLESAKMANPRKFDVFISHSGADRKWASKFVDVLEANGVHAWLDDAVVQPGDEWSGQVEEALREAPVLAVLVSPDYLSSPWQAFELGAALGGKKKIIPIITEPAQNVPLPSPLRELKSLEEASPEAAGKLVADVVRGTTINKL